jgi:hypothetical protein
MRQRIRSHLTYANVMATIAVFLVLSGGTAIALTGSNTVFSDDIVNDQVFSADVRSDTLAGGGLTAADLRPASVGRSEVTDNSLRGADIANGTLGTDDYGDNGIGSIDIAKGAVTSHKVANFDLNDEDVGQGTLVNFSQFIGSVTAGGCLFTPINMSPFNGTLPQPPDHLLLTPIDPGVSNLDYSSQWLFGAAYVKVCNYTAAAIDGGTVHFSLLVFDAQ